MCIENFYNTFETKLLFSYVSKKDYPSNYLAISIILDRDIYSTDTFDKIISNTDNTDLLGYPLLDSLFG